MGVYLWAMLLVGVLSGQYHDLSLPWYLVYSDVIPFADKALDTGIPYLETPFEYPVITGLFIRLMGVIGGTVTNYYRVSVVFLTLFAVAATALLFRMAGMERKRLLRYWIFAPSMLMFLAVNWDIIAVFFSVAAFFAMERKQYPAAAALLALGFSSKFYPVFYMVPLLLIAQPLLARAKLVLVFLLVALAVNLPFIALSFDGWNFFFEMSSKRVPNPDSIWGGIDRIFPALTTNDINSYSLALFGLGFMFLVRFFRKAPPLAFSFLLTLLFLLTSKVFSPQYALWLLPFFVLLDVRMPKMFLAFELANLAVFATALAWLFTEVPREIIWVTAAASAVRHAALIAIAAIFAARLLRRPSWTPENSFSSSESARLGRAS